MITELERARKAYANITQRMKAPGLSGREIGFLQSTLAKAKETLKQAHSPKAELKTEPKARPSHLPFHFYAIPGSQQAFVLVDRVYEQWQQFHHFKRTQSATRLQEYRSIIGGLVSNLLYALAMQRPGVFVTRGIVCIPPTPR